MNLDDKSPFPLPPRLLGAHREKFREWLNQWEYSRFVTLSFNAPGTSVEAAVKSLRHWDARVNRGLVGHQWTGNMKEDRIWYFALLEKPDRNVHWHLLLRFMPWARLEQEVRFGDAASRHWKKLVASGSCDVQMPYDEKGVKYVVKELWNPVSYAQFVVPDQFC